MLVAALMFAKIPTHVIHGQGPDETNKVGRWAFMLRGIRFPHSRRSYNLELVTINLMVNSWPSSEEAYAILYTKVGKRLWKQAIKEENGMFLWRADCVLYRGTIPLLAICQVAQWDETDVFTLNRKGIEQKPVARDLMMADTDHIDRGVVVEHKPAKYVVGFRHPEKWTYRRRTWTFDPKSLDFNPGPWLNEHRASAAEYAKSLQKP